MSPTWGCSAEVAASRRARRLPRLHVVEEGSRWISTLRRERRGARHRMADEGVAVQEDAGAPRSRRVEDFFSHEQGADRRVASPEALGDGDQVRRDALLLDRPQRPVRPIPHITSSSINRMPWLSQISRTRRK